MSQPLRTCPGCGAPLMQRSRARLFIASVLFFAGAAILVLLVHLLLAMVGAVALVVMGIYFYTWATKAHGLWCRQCKRSPY